MQKQKQKQKNASKDREKRRPVALKDDRGRVHLALHRDPASGDEYVTLQAPVFEEAWQNELVAGTANTARIVLRGQPSVERAVELARSVMVATSRLVDGLLARAPAGAVACKAGCDHCCYQSVGVTPPEALAIWDHLTRTLPEHELAAVTAHIAELHARTRSLDSSERFSPDHPCPFLDAGRCTVYEVRPLSCRGMNSLDAAECSRRLRDPQARAAFLQNGLGSQAFLEPIRAFHATSAGLQLGLAELYQLDMRPLELTAAMNLLLTGPASLARRWIEGDEPFAPARGGESTVGRPGDRTRE
jgi:hypothetical protein